MNEEIFEDYFGKVDVGEAKLRMSNVVSPFSDDDISQYVFCSNSKALPSSHTLVEYYKIYSQTERLQTSH